MDALGGVNWMHPMEAKICTQCFNVVPLGAGDSAHPMH